MPVVHEFSLSWEMPDPQEVLNIETQYGADCWPTLDWDTLPLTWRAVGPVVWRDDEEDAEWPHGQTAHSRLQQARQLVQWANTKHQPVRNIVLKRRVFVDQDDWQEIVVP
jgi:hypothetical protein